MPVQEPHGRVHARNEPDLEWAAIAANRSSVRLWRSLVVLSLICAACAAGSDPTHKAAAGRPLAQGEPTGGARSTAAATLSDVATGLDVPWGVAFAPDGRVFVNEREGRVLELSPNGSRQVVHEFAVDATGEAGLLGLAASPSFASDGWLYAYLTTSADNRVVRFRPGGPVEPILTGIPKAAYHDGGIIAFAPDGMLFIGTGDARVEDRAQDLNSLAGKILRVQADGRVPADNPFPGSPVWSFGHRNVQGLAWSASGQLYATDFGPDRDDEINLIRAGGNYGWPVVTGEAGRDGFIDPIFVRQPSEASWSQLALLLNSSLSQWDGDLFAAGLRGQRLWRMRLGADGGVVESEVLLVRQLGRLRGAKQAPDGSLWLWTSNRDGRGDPRAGDDRIVRFGP